MSSLLPSLSRSLCLVLPPTTSSIYIPFLYSLLSSVGWLPSAQDIAPETTLDNKDVQFLICFINSLLRPLRKCKQFANTCRREPIYLLARCGALLCHCIALSFARPSVYLYTQDPLVLLSIHSRQGKRIQTIQYAPN